MIFGLAHASNVFAEGSKVTLQVVVTIVARYFFYLDLASSRRAVADDAGDDSQ